MIARARPQWALIVAFLLTIAHLILTARGVRVQVPVYWLVPLVYAITAFFQYDDPPIFKATCQLALSYAPVLATSLFRSFVGYVPPALYYGVHIAAFLLQAALRCMGLRGYWRRQEHSLYSAAFSACIAYTLAEVVLMLTLWFDGAHNAEPIRLSARVSSAALALQLMQLIFLGAIAIWPPPLRLVVRENLQRGGASSALSGGLGDGGSDGANGGVDARESEGASGGADGGATGGAHGGVTGGAHGGVTGGAHGGATGGAHGGSAGLGLGAHPGGMVGEEFVPGGGLVDGGGVGPAHGDALGAVHGGVAGIVHGGIAGTVHGGVSGTVHGGAAGTVHGVVSGTVHGGVHGSASSSGGNPTAPFALGNHAAGASNANPHAFPPGSSGAFPPGNPPGYRVDAAGTFLGDSPDLPELEDMPDLENPDDRIDEVALWRRMGRRMGDTHPDGEHGGHGGHGGHDDPGHGPHLGR